MNNWLEEAESKNQKVDDSDNVFAKIQAKKKDIARNYESNKDAYDAFFQELNGLVQRVNNLPLEHRKQFGKLKIKEKESRLTNKLYYVSSSRRVSKRLYSGFFRFFSKSHFKNIRVCYFTISRNMGKVNVELKENLLIKTRIKANGDSERNAGMRKKNWGRKDYLFRLEMTSLNKDRAMEIIDFIAFKIEMEELSFFSDGQSEPKS
jgi:hypothetical protein